MLCVNVKRRGWEEDLARVRRRIDRRYTGSKEDASVFSSPLSSPVSNIRLVSFDFHPPSSHRRAIGSYFGRFGGCAVISTCL